jgi:hypothetical protein
MSVHNLGPRAARQRASRHVPGVRCANRRHAESRGPKPLPSVLEPSNRGESSLIRYNLYTRIAIRFGYHILQ